MSQNQPSNNIFTTFVDYYKVKKELPDFIKIKTTSSLNTSDLKLSMLMYESVPDGTTELKKWLRKHHIGISTETQIHFRRDLYEDLFSRIPTAKHHELLVSFTVFRDYKKSCNTMSDETVIKNTIDLFGVLPSDSDEPNYHYLNSKGIRTCGLILGALKRALPQLNYCPNLRPIIILLLHIVPDDENIFMWVSKLCSESENDNPKSLKFLCTTPDEFDCATQTLELLSQKYAKKYYLDDKHTAKDFKNFRSWLLESLPFYYCLLVLDAYLLEGYKVFYRFSLYLLKIYTKQQINREKEYRREDKKLQEQSIHSFCKNIDKIHRMNVSNFKEGAFSIKRFSKSEIRKLLKQAFAQIHGGIQSRSANLALEEVRRKSHSFLARHDDFAPSTSSIVSHSQFCQIYNWLPEYFQVMNCRKKFASNTDGFSFGNMLSRTSQCENVIFLLRNEMNHIFGFFLTKWMDKCMGDVSGNGECILFTLEPNTKVFEWKEMESENLFYLADWNQLNVGGTSDPKASAVTIEKNFSKCTFGCSKTFGMVQSVLDIESRFFLNFLSEIYSIRTFCIWQKFTGRLCKRRHAM